MEAHTLPGDQLLAGPVLLDHRAVWAEAGRRLLLRSLDAHGRTRTLFSSSKAPGAPKNSLWPFHVRSITAGNGRIAFVESIIWCGSAPPGTPGCTPSTLGPRVDSVTVFTGRPGAIKPVDTLMRPEWPCHRGRPDTRALGLTEAGLVDYEISAGPCSQGFSRLALRSFSGRLVRVLAPELPVETNFVVAGDRAGLIRSFHNKEPEELKIVRLSTGQTELRLRRRCLESMAALSLEPSGRFALAAGGRCPKQHGNTLMVGQTGHAHLQTIARDVLVSDPSASIVMARGYVAYERSTGHSRTDAQVMVAAPGTAPRPVPGIKPAGPMAPLAFDGRVIATAHKNSVQLVALRKG